MQAVNLGGVLGIHRGSEVKGITQTCFLWEAPGRVPIDTRHGAGQSVSYQGHLIQDRGDGAEGPVGNASGGVPINRIQIKQLHRRASSAGATRHHGGHGDGYGMKDLRRVRAREDGRGHPSELDYLI